MKYKTGERIDNLTVIRRTHSTEKNHEWLCKCDCGREVIKSDYVLSYPSVRYKACGHDDCEFSGIRNVEQDTKSIKKRHKQNLSSRREKKVVIHIDSILANICLRMAWR